MPNIARQRVARHVRCPFVFRGVGRTDADKSCLKSLELLLRAEFIGHCRGSLVGSLGRGFGRVAVGVKSRASLGSCLAKPQ